MRSGAAQTRDRVLADDEIRDLWVALDTVKDVPACYPRFVKFLMLTATRRDEAADMHSAEVDGDIWVIPASRYKSKVDQAIPLSAPAKALIGSKPEGGRKGNGWYTFSTTDGEKPFAGFSKAKSALDKAIAADREREGREPMTNWTLHDLRRTARTLLSRAKVPADHAERCLGHVIGGVRGVYDRYAFLEEKRCAFEALAGLIDDIRSAR
jgi:integrase